MNGELGSLISEPMLTTSKKLLALVLFSLFAMGCAMKREAPVGASAVEAPPADVAVPNGNIPKSERARIVTMDMAIVVDDFDGASNKLRAAVARAGGYVSDMHGGGVGDERSARFEIRVPAERVEEVRGSLTGLGEITSANEKVEDVTEQRADIDARLANAKVQEKRLLEIMATKSGSISDLVESEKELSRVRENIERLEAQQRSLKSKIDLATIHVDLRARSVSAWQTPGTSLAGAGKSGMKGAAAVAVYATMAFLTLAPTMLPIAAVVFVVYMILRRRRSTTAVTIDPTAA